MVLSEKEWLEFEAIMRGKAKSRCYCGHTGEGRNSQHGDFYADGQGDCRVNGCACARFKWKEWMPRTLKALRGFKNWQ